MSSAALAHISLDQYLADEEASLDKHEWLDGVVVAMAGGTPEHALLKTNVTVSVASALRGKPCRVFDADLRVRCPSRLLTYPDLSVVCGPFVRDRSDKNAATNPTVLFEVLSPSTAAYDRGEKFDHYMTIPSLLVYVLVDHARPRIDVFTRVDEETWMLRRYGPGRRIELPFIDATITVDDVYEGWAELREELSGE